MAKSVIVGSRAEQRTRVTCHLPLQTAEEEKAAIEVARYIRAQKDDGIGVTGYHQADGFSGAWWSEKKQIWIYDQMLLLIVDYSLSLGDPDHALMEVITKLKQAIVAAYTKHGSKQEEIWITSEKLTRYI